MNTADEVILDVPELIAGEVVAVTQELMIGAMREVVPDVTIRVEATLMRRWSKKAEAVYDGKGVLAPWEDRLIKQLFDSKGSPVTAAA